MRRRDAAGSHVDRRALLLGAGAAALGACVPRRAPVAAPAPRVEPAWTPMAIATGAAAFIRTQAVTTQHGMTWRKSPDELTPRSDYYHGGPGVARFLLEMFRATGERVYLDEAILGMDHARATREPDEIGLHGGHGGDAFVWGELFATTGDARHRAAAIEAVDRLIAKATPAGAGLDLMGMNDIMYGSASAIAVLLRAAEALDHAPALDAAHRLGLRLAETGEAMGTGVRWLDEAGATYAMPNFAHGTAGVAYALAALHARTGAPTVLTAAIDAAAYLLSIADTADGGCRVYHSDRTRGIYYLSPCHGPAGLSRLFEQLHRVTGRDEWRGWVLRCASSVIDSGIPAVRTPGFWDNVGQCCGSAGIAEWMLSLHDLTGDPTYAAMADALVDDVLAHRCPGPAGGLQWVHAENRVQPHWRQSYTGTMQGAAGIGALFLRLAGRAARSTYVCRPVDNPFPL